MTLCEEVCPLTTGALLRLRQLMGDAGAGRHFAVLEITTDPWRDHPSRLRAYRRRAVGVPILTGTLAAVRHLWRFFGVHFERVPAERPAPVDWLTGQREKFDVEHTDGVFLIDPSGRERVAVAGAPNLGGHLSPALRAELNPEGRQYLERPQGGWTPQGIATDLVRLMGLASPKPPLPSSGADMLLPERGLARKLGQLRGLPVVINAWASWCPPCREELPLFATASAKFGNRVAFLGADVEDQADDARRLLADQALTYPSYETSLDGLSREVGAIRGTPVTFFIGPEGDVRQEHIGAYSSQSALNADIRRYGAD